MNLDTVSPNSLAEAKKHLDRAYSYYGETEEFNQALLECDAALEIDPSLAVAHNLRGIVLEKLGCKAEALQAYQQALEFDQDFSEAKENLTTLEDKLALLPRWLRNGIVAILVFNVVTYTLESYLLSKSHFLIWDRLFVVVLATLNTPGIIIQFLLGNQVSRPEIFNWTIRSISSLTFGYMAGAVTLKRKKVLQIITILLLSLYLLFFGVWGLLLWLGSSFYG